jgi:hypothetical protein
MQKTVNARITLSILTGAAVLAGLAAATVPAHAQWLNYPTPGIPRTQDGRPNLSAPAPKTAEGKPSMEGIWTRVRGPNAPISNPAGLPGNLTYYMPKDAQIPMQPWAEALFKQRSGNFGAGRPSQRCLPHGIPDAMLYGGPMKIVQGPGLTIILYEEFNHYRQVFTDGRPFPQDPQPSWFGSSVGKWDGDAFVVETVAFNDQTWLDDSGHPHTDAMRTTERFRRRDFGHMEMQLTIDDPKAYTRPWSVTIGFDLLPDTDLIEDICDNERDSSRIEGVYKK